ncbi:MAG: glycosyltransferase family 4 protein [Candidatus Kerfeldbacteria bacterium]
MKNLQDSNKRIKIFFLAWGYSIHAYRRISIFAEDPNFEVALASTFPYKIPNVRFYALTNAKIIEHSLNKTSKIVSKSEQIYLKRIRTGIKKFIMYIYSFLKKLIIKTHLLDEISADTLYDISIFLRDRKILQNAVKDFQPNIIFLQTVLYPSYLAFCLPKSLPIVITFWNGDITWWAKWNGIDRLLKKKIVKHAVKRAKSITVNSQTALEKARTYGAELKKIHLIRYPGVDLNVFYPRSKQEARKKLNISKKQVILWPRGIADYLNFDIFLKAIFKILPKNPNILILILSKVGMEHTEKIKKVISEKGFEQNFNWILQVKSEDMPWYYAASDIMVSISSNDSFPNVMAEAMACGTLVIMGDIPQIREIIKDQINGFLVKPKDVDQLANLINKIFNNQYKKQIEHIINSNLTLAKNKFDKQLNSKIIKELIKKLVNTN